MSAINRLKDDLATLKVLKEWCQEFERFSRAPKTWKRGRGFLKNARALYRWCQEEDIDGWPVGALAEGMQHGPLTLKEFEAAKTVVGQLEGILTARVKASVAEAERRYHKAEEAVYSGRPEARRQNGAGLAAEFMFIGEAQAFFRRMDLHLPTGFTLRVLKRLRQSWGMVVLFKELMEHDVPKESEASPELKRAIFTINKALTEAEAPCRIQSRRGQGYLLA